MPTVRESLLEEAFAGVPAALLCAGTFEVRRFFAGFFEGGCGLGGAAIPASAGPVWLVSVCPSAAAERNAPSTSARTVGSTWNIRSASA
jgi:hypothetical protein